MFQVFDVNWPGRTNDIVAYHQTQLWHNVEDGKIPQWAHFVLDEAYSSCGGCHLTPWSKMQLHYAKYVLKDMDMYQARLGFNFYLSSQRITIERAFGMLVRRWGVYWRCMRFSLKHSTIISSVCAILHNVCVADWKKKGGHRRHPNQYGPDVPDHVNMDDADMMNPLEGIVVGNACE